ncbi:unnamed protein product [Trichobilharzia regenti]|nr:unnamed protein product [Trichobilharzia regenti]
MIVTREMVDKSLSIIVPAVKNTAEFVTIPDITWADVGGLESTRQQLYNRFMVRRLIPSYYYYYRKITI